MLYVRMFFYLLAGIVAGVGLAHYDPVAQTLTVELDRAAELVYGGLGAFAATFASSRFAKWRGGQT